MAYSELAGSGSNASFSSDLIELLPSIGYPQVAIDGLGRGHVDDDHTLELLGLR